MKLSSIPEESREIFTWLALAVIDPNPYGTCEQRLKEIRKNVPDEAQFVPYLDFSNELLEKLDTAKTELLQFLVELLLSTQPRIDKLNDVTLILTLSSYIDPKYLVKLDKFKAACLKGSND
jgi:hypothetical protein